MPTADIFTYQDYKQYINDWISIQPKAGHGIRSLMAQTLHCQTAFVSQVLNGDKHFSAEQIEKLNSLFGHSKEEAHFLLLLLSYTRAGTEGLKKYYYEQIQNVLHDHTQLKNRIKDRIPLAEIVQSKYFSAWQYSAIHVLISIPAYQTRGAIAEALQLPQKLVTEILHFLVETGLAEKRGDHYITGPSFFHLAKDSPEINKHHMNWRLRTMLAIEDEKPNDLHYSSVISLSRKDILKIKKILADNVEKIKELTTASKQESLFSFCIDFFQLIKN